jgi:hypothetical protein
MADSGNGFFAPGAGDGSRSCIALESFFSAAIALISSIQASSKAQ